MPDAPTGSQQALRREGDTPARRLEFRPSVDEAKHGTVLCWVGLLAAGMSWALVFDQTAKASSHPARAHPDLWAVAPLGLGATAVFLLLRSAAAMRRSRRMAREEATLFARLRELRGAPEFHR